MWPGAEKKSCRGRYYPLLLYEFPNSRVAIRFSQKNGSISPFFESAVFGSSLTIREEIMKSTVKFW